MIFKLTEEADFAIVADPAVVAFGHYGGVGRLRRLKATSTNLQSVIYNFKILLVRVGVCALCSP